LQYIAIEINANEEEDQLSAPTKEQLDQEKQLLLAFKPVMQKFLHDHQDLQVSALYALQVHCNAKAFPKGMYRSRGEIITMQTHLPHGFCLKFFLNTDLSSLGMLLRYFVHFYDMEIIEEEAFLAWKEDITQEFPGKGKALFQVIRFVLPDNLYCNSHHCRCIQNWLFLLDQKCITHVCGVSLFWAHGMFPVKVNQWLTWLETAEEEESEEEAD
jgi:hypothetical protein